MSSKNIQCHCQSSSPKTTTSVLLSDELVRRWPKAPTWQFRPAIADTTCSAPMTRRTRSLLHPPKTPTISRRNPRCPDGGCATSRTTGNKDHRRSRRRAPRPHLRTSPTMGSRIPDRHEHLARLLRDQRTDLMPRAGRLGAIHVERRAEHHVPQFIACATYAICGVRIRRPAPLHHLQADDDPAPVSETHSNNMAQITDRRAVHQIPLRIHAAIRPRP